VGDRNGLAVYDVASISPDLRARMLSLLRMNYDDVSEAQFERDLAEKEWAIIGLWPDGEVWAFSTLRRIRTEVDGRIVTAFYSGDSASHPDTFGGATSAAIRLLLRKIFAEEDRDRTADVYYWFMISSTYKSYRLLSQLFVDFAPSPERNLTDAEKRVVAALSSAKGFQLDQERSIVRFPNPSLPRLDISELEARRNHDELAAFFHRRNPGASGGDRLASLARLEADNLTSLGKRFVLDAPVSE
jgi:hypothetical protein